MQGPKISPETTANHPKYISAVVMLLFRRLVTGQNAAKMQHLTAMSNTSRKKKTRKKTHMLTRHWCPEMYDPVLETLKSPNQMPSLPTTSDILQRILLDADSEIPA